MLEIAICDDDVIFTGKTEDLLEKLGQRYKIQLDIEVFWDGQELVETIKSGKRFDIIYLDIEMKKMSGIELSNIIRKKNKTVNLVFVTGEFKYALHGYKVGALQYLMKPIKKEDLFECLDIIKEKIKVTNDSGNYITIELPKRSIKLNCETIEYCIMFSPYIDIYTTSDKITIRKKISDMEQMLPKGNFVRCHRSYLVNIKYIKVVNKDTITLENGIKIPISRGKYEEVNEAFIR